MSWNRSYSSLQTFRDRVPSFESGEQSSDQLDAAHQAAEAMIASGAIGCDGKDFRVTFYGRSNLDHEPQLYAANDCLSVSVTQS